MKYPILLAPVRPFIRALSSIVPKTATPSPPLLIKEGTSGRCSISGQIVTVFGCNGFIGRKLVNRLAQQGTQVIVPYRDDYTNRPLKLMGDLGQIVPMEFSIYDHDALMKCVRHSDVVFNLIGRDYETKGFTFEQTHVHASRNIAYACRQMGVPMFVQMSHLSAHLNSKCQYLKTKAEAEIAVKEEFPNATLVRSSSVYGHEDRFIHLLGWLSELPFLPVYNNGKTIFRPVCASDVALGLTNLAFDAQTIGNTYEFYGPKAYTFEELVDTWLYIAYKYRQKIYPPKKLALLHAYLYDKTDLDPFLSTDIIERLYIDEHPTLENALTLEDLGVLKLKVFEYTALEYIRVYRNSTTYMYPGPVPSDEEGLS